MIDAATRRRVRERAGNRCEYCGLHQDHSPLATLQIEHVSPRKHCGTDAIENLACIDCNLSKSSNIAGRDPQSSDIIPLFNPRRDVLKLRISSGLEARHNLCRWCQPPE